MSIWRQNSDLMDRLAKVQNHKNNYHVDIMTFAAFMKTKEELENYVKNHEDAVKDK